MTDSSEPAVGAKPTTPATTGDKLLLAAFWIWAVALVVLTLAQLFGWQGVLDVLDVKRWFAR